MKLRNNKSEMEAISKRYLPDEKLKSPIAKLFRGLLNEMGMNPYKWARLLHDYLSWVVTSDKENERRAQILMKTGNIRDAYFHNPKLTADKLFEGLSILQMEECEITLKAKDSKGNVYEVKTVVPIKHARNSVTADEEVTDDV